MHQYIRTLESRTRDCIYPPTQIAVELDKAI